MRKLNCGNVGAAGGGMVCTQKTKEKNWQESVKGEQGLQEETRSSGLALVPE